MSRLVVNLPADNSRVIAITHCQTGNNVFYITMVTVATPGSMLTPSVLNRNSIIPLNQYVGVLF